MPQASGSDPSRPARASTMIEPRADRPPPRSATLIESDEAPVAPAIAPTATPAPSPGESVRRAQPYRPTARPPMAVLTVFDDGREEGEDVRIRGDSFVIGRTEGDLLLPHDARISSRHAEIARRPAAGGWRWVVTDLQSTNGLFVRVRRAALVPGSELLVGGGRYRFEATGPAPSEIPGTVAPPGRGQTLGWAGDAPARSPSLVEMIGQEPGASVALMRPEYWIGIDPSCPIRREDDPFCEPRHARLIRSPSGDWTAENNKAHNGLWLRMPQFDVESMVYFQVGEQRLRLKVR